MPFLSEINVLLNYVERGERALLGSQKLMSKKNKRSWSCIRINIRTLLTGQLLKLKVFSGHHG